MAAIFPMVSSFTPFQGTLDNAWRHFWLSHLGREAPESRVLGREGGAAPPWGVMPTHEFTASGGPCSPGWSCPAVSFHMERWRSAGEVAGAQDRRGGRRQRWRKPVSPRSLEPGSRWHPPVSAAWMWSSRQSGNFWGCSSDWLV